MRRPLTLTGAYAELDISVKLLFSRAHFPHDFSIHCVGTRSQ